MKSLKKTKTQNKSIRKKKSLVRIPITTKGGLFGYHVDMPLDTRRSLLKKILRTGLATYSEVVKRLNVLSGSDELKSIHILSITDLVGYQ